jgi:hypothetical protein
VVNNLEAYNVSNTDCDLNLMDEGKNRIRNAAGSAEMRPVGASRGTKAGTRVGRGSIGERLEAPHGGSSDPVLTIGGQTPLTGPATVATLQHRTGPRNNPMDEVKPLKRTTANQYLAGIGLGPVNLVCAGCHKEVGRTWTKYKLCADCVSKHAKLFPAAAKRARQYFLG